MNTDNINILNETLAILNQGYYTVNGQQVQLKLSQRQMEEIHVFLPEGIAALQPGKAAYNGLAKLRACVGCEQTDSYSMALELAKYMDSLHTMHGKPVLVLNFANSVHPGGGVRKGSRAQEEDLCRKSSLLRSLETSHAARYYKYNLSLNTRMGSDAVMITPQVEIIRDADGNLLPESQVVSVMTCAAPDLRTGMEGLSDARYRAMLRQRISGMLAVAAHLGYEVLVLGAFGCGAFQNDARVVSDLFAEALRSFSFYGKTLDDCFRCIMFAVRDHSQSQYNISEFRRNFGDYYHDGGENINSQEPPAPVEPEEKSYVFFWKDHEENGYLSNWYKAPFTIEGITYSCVEQYMMSRKALLFRDYQKFDEIMRSTSPREMKTLGKLVANFEHDPWDACRQEAVYNACYAKFSQNPKLKALLLATGDCVLVEASPKDPVWGIGLDAATAARMDPATWPGQGLLGKVLMRVRDELAKEAE